MSEHSVQNWQILANGLYWAALVLGALTVFASFAASFSSRKAQEYFQAEAEQKIAAARVEAAGANERTAQVNERAARLENEAEHARLETERLKQQFAWRRLNEKQFRTLVEGLTGLNLTIHLSAIATDPEAMLFATDIQRALRAAGFNVHIESSVIFASGPVVGIQIAGPKNDVIKVAEAFTAIGLDITGHEQESDINILIGSKPPPQ